MEAVTNLNEDTIKLTGGNIDNKMFAAAINKLANHTGFDVKVAYNIGYISKKIQSFTQDMMKVHSEMVLKHSDKDEKGNTLMTFSEEAQKAYAKELETAHEIEHEIRKKKLNVNTLSEQGFVFTGNDISVLEPLLCGLED